MRERRRRPEMEHQPATPVMDSGESSAAPLQLASAGVGTTDLGALLSSGGNQAMVQQFGSGASGARNRRAAGGNDGPTSTPTSDGGDSGGSGSGGSSAESTPDPELPIEAKLTAEKEVVPGLGVEPFGQMDPTFSFRNAVTKVEDGKIKLDATLHAKYHWGVNSGGNIDVVTGREDFITVDNYADVAQDLDPDNGQDAGAADYETYWSKKATEDHELEHARDDWEEFLVPSGVDLAKAKFAEHKATAGNAETKVNQLITTGGSEDRHPGLIPSEVFLASDAHYGIPADYMDRPGEIKAHAVGALVERPLVVKIREYGAELEAERDAAEAAAASASASNTGGESGGGESASDDRGRKGTPSRERPDDEDDDARKSAARPPSR